MATGYECVGERSILIDVTNDITDVEKERTGSSKWVIFSMQLLRWGIEAFSASLRVGVVKWSMMLGTPPTQLKGATSLSHWHHWITVHQTCEAYKDGDVKSLLRRLEFCLQKHSMKIAVEMYNSPQYKPSVIVYSILNVVSNLCDFVSSIEHKSRHFQVCSCCSFSCTI